MNKYKKGADFERDVVNEARAKGFIAFRSAGSHSPIDVCIIDIKNKAIYFHQCKAGRYAHRPKKKIDEQFKDLNGVFNVRFWTKIRGY